jgi:hypothetical protein
MIAAESIPLGIINLRWLEDKSGEVGKSPGKLGKVPKDI